MTFSAGEEVTATKLNLELRAGTIIARARRTSNSTATSGATELGCLRLDDVPITDGRIYRIAVNTQANSSVSSDFIITRLAYTTDGSTPTTSSSTLPGTEHRCEGNTSSIHRDKSKVTHYIPSSDETLSLLLCYRRSSGTGAVTVVNDGTAFITEIIVTDCGVDPGDDGVDI